MDQIPLITALRFNHCSEIIKMLVDRGSDINQLSNEGVSPSFMAQVLKIKLESQQKENVAYNEELRMRKLLASMWSLLGTTELLPNIKINLHGIPRYFGSNEIHRLLQIFQEAKTPKDSKELKTAVDVLGTIHTNLLANSEEIAKQYNKGTSLCFNTGWTGHGIEVIFFEKYMLVCNRGYDRQASSITPFAIDRTRSMSETDIEQLKFGAEEPKQSSYFCEELPKSLGYVSDDSDLIVRIFKRYAQHDQKGSNCDLVSAKTAVLASLAIQKLLDPKLFTGKDLIAYEQAFNEAYATYKQFSEFCRIQVLKEYLQFKVEEKKNTISDAIPPDHSLVKTIVEKLYTKNYKNFFNKNKIQSLLEQYQQIFSEYQEAFPLRQRQKTNIINQARC
jgi:hypothetical protein